MAKTLYHALRTWGTVRTNSAIRRYPPRRNQCASAHEKTLSTISTPAAKNRR